MAWRTHYVGHLRAVNNNFLDTYQLKSQNALLDGEIRNIERRDDGTYRVTVAFIRADEVTKDIPYDRVIVCAGFRFDTAVFDDTCRPDLHVSGRFPELTPAYESVNVPGMYFAGTITQSRDFKRGTSGFIHGFRYGSRALHRILEERHHGSPWPAREIGADPKAMAQAVLDRVNRSSALWQQFGLIADVIALDGRGGARYLEERPIDLPIEADSTSPSPWSTAPTTTRSTPSTSPSAASRQSDAERADEGHYLHPVVRHHGPDGQRSPSTT